MHGQTSALQSLMDFSYKRLYELSHGSQAGSISILQGLHQLQPVLSQLTDTVAESD